jgi:pimeloyl-ACP methyl ester carboxylesterase
MTGGSAVEFEDVTSVPVNGTRLAYREVGSGEPVVFVHGDLSDLRSWERLLPSVGASHRAITYSRRYARPNEDIPPGVDNQMLPHVEDLAAFLREIDATPAHLVGNSWGAFIALLTAIRNPDLVRSIVLGEPPAITLFVSMPPRPQELLRLLATRPRTAVAIAGFGAKVISPTEKAFRRGDDEAARRAFVGGVLGEERWRAMPEARRQQAEANISALRASMLGAGFPKPTQEELRGVTTPALLVEGEHTKAVFRRILDRLEEMLPHTERAMIPGATHTQEENPEAYTELLLGFLSRQA